MGSPGREVAKKAMWLYPKVIGFNPPERWGHSACYSQGFIYVFGGCCGGLHFSDVVALNLEKMSWAKLSTLGPGPGPRDSHSTVLVGRKMIVFGGTNGSKKVNDLHVLDLDSREWARPICKGGPPSPRESHTATLVGDDEVVVFGGSGEGDANYLNDLYILDLNTMSWKSPLVKGNAPIPRDSHSAVSVGRKIFVYGGDCGDRYEGDIDMFDMDTLIWSRLVVRGSSPGVRAGHAAVNIGPKVYVIGGVGDKQYYNDVWVFDISTCSWTQVEVRGQRPQGRFSHTAIVAEKDIVIFGGCGEDEHPVNELLVLQLGDEHPNGRYNISLCKIFGKHFNSERRRPSREMEQYPKNIIMGTSGGKAMRDDRENEFEPNNSLQLNSDVLQLKRKRTSTSKSLEIESEPEEHSLSLSQQSSPSQSDQEQTPTNNASSSQVFPFPSFKKKSRNSFNVPTKDVSNTLSKPKCSVRINPHDLHFSRETPNKRNSEQNIRIVHMGRRKAPSQPTDGASINAGPSHNMVGAEVQGKVDGSFDSGYLMTAMVNGRIFRGVLFPPGQEVVSKGIIMAQSTSPQNNEIANVSPLNYRATHTTPAIGIISSTNYLRESGIPQMLQSSPTIRSTSTNGIEKKIKNDPPAVFLTLGGPGT